jgi:hypothetical protein
MNVTKNFILNRESELRIAQNLISKSVILEDGTYNITDVEVLATISKLMDVLSSGFAKCVILGVLSSKNFSNKEAELIGFEMLRSGISL